MANSTVITDYVGRGTHAARPATPPISSDALAVYYETDTTNTFVWSGSAWVQINSAGGSTTLAGDTDVSISSPTNGQVLTYSSGTSKWANAAAGSISNPSVVQAAYARASSPSITQGTTPAAGNVALAFRAGHSIGAMSQTMIDKVSLTCFSSNDFGIISSRLIQGGDSSTYSSTDSGPSNLAVIEISNCGFIETVGFGNNGSGTFTYIPSPETVSAAQLAPPNAFMSHRGSALAFYLVSWDSVCTAVTTPTGWTLLQFFGNDGSGHTAAIYQRTAALAVGDAFTPPSVTGTGASNPGAGLIAIVSAP